MKLHTCADQPNCGRSFFAHEQDRLICPYCGELAEPETVQP